MGMDLNYLWRIAFVNINDGLAYYLMWIVIKDHTGWSKGLKTPILNTYSPINETP